MSIAHLTVYKCGCSLVDPALGPDACPRHGLFITGRDRIPAQDVLDEAWGWTEAT